MEIQMDIQAAIIPVTPFAQNCSLIWCTATMKAAVIDPGGDIDRIQEAIKETGVTVEKILITHAHIDHAGGAADLAEALDVAIEGPHRDDDWLIQELPEKGAEYGFANARSFTPARWLENDDTVTVGNVTLGVRHCPGHTPGHVIFHHEGAKLAVVGDVLFQGSIGRTDFPRGDHATLINSITQRLWPLGDDTTFISGHGQVSTFGDERQTNPFVGDAALG